MESSFWELKKKFSKNIFYWIFLPEKSIPHHIVYTEHKSENVICLYVDILGVCFKEISGFI